LSANIKRNWKRLAVLTNVLAYNTAEFYVLAQVSECFLLAPWDHARYFKATEAEWYHVTILVVFYRHFKIEWLQTRLGEH